MAILTSRLHHQADWELAVTRWSTWQSRTIQKKKRMMRMTVMRMRMMTSVRSFNTKPLYQKLLMHFVGQVKTAGSLTVESMKTMLNLVLQ